MSTWLQGWSLSPIGGWWGAAAMIALLVALLWIGPRSRKLTHERRRALLVLRLVAIAVALWAMLRPTWVHVTEVKHSSTLVILADRSRSMQVDDEYPKRTRWQALHAALDDLAP